MTPPKATLDAMTDRSLAFAREHRADAEPEMLRLSGEAAALLIAQFPGQFGITGRVVMCVAQQITGVQALLEDGEGKRHPRPAGRCLRPGRRAGRPGSGCAVILYALLAILAALPALKARRP